MIQALMSGLSSIQAQQMSMDVIGNNLANIGTTAYKGQNMTFSDLMSQQFQGATAPTTTQGGTNPVQIGLGVQVASTTTDESQGALTATSNPSDMAIQGNGYFMVSNGSQVSYTRDGSFSLDADGNLVNTDNGQELLGWTANANGVVNTTTQLSPGDGIKIPLGQLNAAQATTNMTVSGNLSSSAASTDTGTVTETVYDSQGVAHDITIQYSSPQSPPATTPTPPAGAASSWNWTAYQGDSATGTPIGSSSSTGNQPLYFDANGSPLSSLPSGTLNSITIPASGTGTATTLGVNMSGITELGSPTSVSATGQNGFPPGSLQGFSIGQNGTITGNFSNGLTKTLGQIGLASFTNPNGLTNTGNNLFQSSANSGTAVVGTPSSGSFGSVNAGFLEQSNVDLSSNLTNLIATQRGFEANTKIVSTVDEMLSDVIQMKH